MRRAYALAALMAIVCVAPRVRAEGSFEERIARLATGYAALDRDRRAAERRLDEVATTWRTAIAEWRAAEDAYQRAYHLYRGAVSAREAQTTKLEEASATYARAAVRWRQVQTLVVVNAALDIWQIQQLRSGVSGDLRGSCGNGISTSAYRRQLEGDGRSLLGMHIDHIVPKALGGADHPLNYRVVAALENESWGAHWGLDKCLAVGMVRCAMAVGASVVCGSYSGGVRG